MAIINCGKCKGMKKMTGMGMLQETCAECKGIGFIDKAEVEKPKNEPIITIKKKPGRKAKVVTE